MGILIGEKIGMTEVFTDNGDCVAVTVIHVGRCVPVLRRTQENDGYEALMLAYGVRKTKHTNKPLSGFYEKVKVEPARFLREFRGQDVSDEAMGQPLKVDVFSEGDKVSVVGVSKGRGFAGVFKRFNYGMPGRMGGANVRVKNLKVIRVDVENNLLLVKGSIPGANGGIVNITKS